MKSNLMSAALVLCIATLASVYASPNPSCRQYNVERKICIKNSDNVSTKDCICNSEKLNTLYNECHGSNVDPEQFFINELCNINSVNLMKRWTPNFYSNEPDSTIEQEQVTRKIAPKTPVLNKGAPKEELPKNKKKIKHIKKKRLKKEHQRTGMRR
ncbi:2141_t:CDS:1 [Funneliformis mosseae]|uniref:2141_t:CDS:1 n=1 Tax=Funneliformis mosseae TaxID=27381 RepID=A0A9N9ANY0_FUNMO|nr:2141_t:CDS:1 [Funneliformis mosseae]